MAQGVKGGFLVMSGGRGERHPTVAGAEELDEDRQELQKT